MASLKGLPDRNEDLQQVGILNEDLVRPRRLPTFLDNEVVAVLLFGAHLIDWNLRVTTESTEIGRFRHFFLLSQLDFKTWSVLVFARPTAGTAPARRPM